MTVPEPSGAVDWSADTTNVLAALDAAQELGMRPELVSGVNEFAEHLNRSGLLAQAQVRLEQALTAADELEVLLDRLDEAEAHARESVEIAQAQNLPDRLVEPLRTMGTIARRHGRPGSTLAVLDEATMHARSIGNDFLLAEVANERGLAFLEMGDLDAAEASLAAAADHATRADAGDAVGRALFAQAKVALGRDVWAAQELMKLLEPGPTQTGKYNVQIHGNVQGLAAGDDQHIEMTFRSDP